jgi:secreted PhoX family phosphatase
MDEPFAASGGDDRDDDDAGVNPSTNRRLGDIVAARLTRRAALAGLGAAAGTGVLGASDAAAQAQSRASSLGFREIAHELTENHRVPQGYSAQVVVRWGDPVAPDAPPFDPRAQSAAAQLKQFGYDNDFLAFMPLPFGSRSSSRGLLCSNHERTNPILMFPGVTPANLGQLSKERAEVEMASQGHAVVEIRREGKEWRVVKDSVFNRRLTALAQEFRIAGPAAVHARMRTGADPAGLKVIGTLNNCAGGTTPWGTVLSGEENLSSYFVGDASKSQEAAAFRRYGINGRGRYVWGRYHDRFDLGKEPNEPNRFGWVVEIDPYDPGSTPVKRTSLGRFKHEGGTTAVSHDGRVAVYSGDDERFEYIYRFVTKGRLDPENRRANMNLLDEGTLYTARFEEGGRLVWLPLVHGQGPLTAANGFASQADVVIEARRAADLMGATPMDRPEDIEPNPVTGSVFVVLTYNEQRKPAGDASARERVNAANPRSNNRFGHIIEIVPPLTDGRPDHAALEYAWDLFLLAGDPSRREHQARYGGPVSANGWIACPDNVAFDPRGRIWIATDGQDDAAGFCDSVYAAETRGRDRGRTRLFCNGPRGAEICGPEFTPDGRTLFIAVQHPAEEKDSTFDKPSTRWPDFKPDMPPRPAVVAITKDDGVEIGR